MSDQWLIVARAIDDRMNELDISQRLLVKRSGLSKAVVREIQHHVVERRRSPRTLEALSVALEWPPDYLLALSRNEPLPGAEDPIARTSDVNRVESRLAAMEQTLDDLHKKIDDLSRSIRSGEPRRRL